ncbi:MAG: heavy-metal-associated domain-containing protein [bacterium]|nr:heavy-metal-associated domain-containing protein [bacterium]
MAGMIDTVTLHPSRIGCPSIPGTMKGIITSLPGVHDVTVRYDDRSVDITFDTAQMSPERIIAAVGKEMGLALEVGAPQAAKEGNVAETCPM